MPRLAIPLPNKRIITRQDLQAFWASGYQETSDQIYRLTKKYMLIPIRKGIFLNAQLGLLGEIGLAKIATTLFPDGYVTGYRALRYWGNTDENYLGLCPRDDPTTDIAVPHSVPRKCEFNGFHFIPRQIKKNLVFDVKNTPNGNIASPEKAILDTIYLDGGIDSGQIEWDLIDEELFLRYAHRFPPKVRNMIYP